MAYKATDYIWNARALLIGLFLFALIECILFCRLGKEKIIHMAEETAILDLNYLHMDVGQKYIVGYKSSILAGLPGEFIQMGDSTGGYGIIPGIVEQYLGGAHFINTNCCADVGWEGYEYTAEYFISHSPNARHLVMHMSPYNLPAHAKLGFSQDVYRTYTSPWSFAYDLPSLYYRKQIVQTMFYGSAITPEDEQSLAMKDIGADENFVKEPGKKDLLQFIKDERGWLPFSVKAEARRKISSEVECSVAILDSANAAKTDLEGENALFLPGFIPLAQIAQKHNMDLIVIFNPVACRDDAKLDGLRRGMKLFEKHHPNVHFLLTFIQRMPIAAFSDLIHLTPDAAIEHSRVVGIALQQYLNIHP